MYIAIDVGGTKTLVCSTKEISKEQLPVIAGELKFETENNFESDFEKLTEAINTLVAGSELSGISIGIPAVLDDKHETILDGVNLTSWYGKNIKQLLTDKYNCKVVVGHDVSAAALGEITYGVKDIAEGVYFIAWGTGIGGSPVFGGKAYTSEFGWQFVGDEYLEPLVGGAAIEKRFGKKAEELSDSEWSKVIKDLAKGVNNVMAITGIKRFIVGGGIGIKQAARLRELQIVTNEIQDDIGLVTVESAKLGEMANIYGLFVRLIDNV